MADEEHRETNNETQEANGNEYTSRKLTYKPTWLVNKKFVTGTPNREKIVIGTANEHQYLVTDEETGDTWQEIKETEEYTSTCDSKTVKAADIAGYCEGHGQPATKLTRCHLCNRMLCEKHFSRLVKLEPEPGLDPYICDSCKEILNEEYKREQRKELIKQLMLSQLKWLFEFLKNPFK